MKQPDSLAGSCRIPPYCPGFLEQKNCQSNSPWTTTLIPGAARLNTIDTLTTLASGEAARVIWKSSYQTFYCYKPPWTLYGHGNHFYLGKRRRMAVPASSRCDQDPASWIKWKSNQERCPLSTSSVCTCTCAPPTTWKSMCTYMCTYK